MLYLMVFSTIPQRHLALGGEKRNTQLWLFATGSSVHWLLSGLEQ